MALVVKIASIIIYLALMVGWFTCIFKPSKCRGGGVRIAALAAIGVTIAVLTALMVKLGVSIAGIAAVVLLIPQLILWISCSSSGCGSASKWGGAGLAILGFVGVLVIPL